MGASDGQETSMTETEIAEIDLEELAEILVQILRHELMLENERIGNL